MPRQPRIKRHRLARPCPLCGQPVEQPQGSSPPKIFCRPSHGVLYPMIKETRGGGRSLLDRSIDKAMADQPHEEYRSAMLRSIRRFLRQTLEDTLKDARG